MKSEKPAKSAIRIISAAALVAVMTAAWWVRLPRCEGYNGGEAPASRTDKYGLQYFVEMDGYFHLRIAEDIASGEGFGTYVDEYDELMDMLSDAPEGREAGYQTGMISAAFVQRSVAGTFDTDIFQAPFNLILIASAAGLAGSSSEKRRALSGLIFSAAAVLYTRFWTVSCLIFIAIAFAGAGKRRSR